MTALFRGDGPRDDLVVDVESAKSKYIIDRRHLIGGAVGAFVVSLVAMFTNSQRPTQPDGDLVGVVSTALDRGQTFWGRELGAGYRPARVVIYNETTESACGLAVSGAGPFYCPGDELIYIDLSFLRSIRGDLARAYVIAHELGHHVQKLRGELGANSSVAIELGADCYAGEWMHSEQLGHHLGGGDIPSALAEAAAVGDDRIRPGSSPETWTHGSAAQRVDAVARGIAGACTR